MTSLSALSGKRPSTGAITVRPAVLPLPRSAHLWLPGYFRARCRSRHGRARGPVHVMFAIADHYEPAHGGVPLSVQRERVAHWRAELPRFCRPFTDADGRPPRHTFFYPQDQYHPELLRPLAELAREGYGEVEIHLHHDNDTSANLRRTLDSFARTLAEQHGLLARASDGTIRYGFVHGDWALDNSAPDGLHCGVNDELTVLLETGCYADFTMPSAPSNPQTRTVNSIYYATDDPARPKSHDTGAPAVAGTRGTGLLLVQGPLVLDWRRAKLGVFPRLDNGAIHAKALPSVARFAGWADARISVAGRPEWLFVKVHAHGAVERNADVLLGRAMSEFHRGLQVFFRERPGWHLHYVTTREMVNIIRAAEDGADGNPADYRDYELRTV